MSIGTTIALAAAAAGVIYAAKPAKKKKKSSSSSSADGLAPPATDIYEYGDIVIAVWKQPKAPPAKGDEFAWALFQGIDVLDVKASRNAAKRWKPPVEILRFSGAESTRAAAKAAAQAEADKLAGGLTPPLLMAYDYRGYVIAIWRSGKDPAKPVEWALFPGGTIDSVVSSSVPSSTGGVVWIPPDGLDVASNGRALDQTAAKIDAEKATLTLEGKQGVEIPPLPPAVSLPPSVPITLVKFFGAADPSVLARLPGVDEAVASADCSVIAIGPLFWERAGNIVGYLLHGGTTSTTTLTDAVLRATLPGCATARGIGIDAIRKAIIDAVRKAKQAPPLHP